MIFKKWKPNQEMYLNKYGIPEPKKTNETFKPDLVLVPLVGYDEKLNRLGYGAGYYDRALKKLSTQIKIITIGIGFSFQKCNKIPVNNNDHVLDHYRDPERDRDHDLIIMIMIMIPSLSNDCPSLGK